MCTDYIINVGRYIRDIYFCSNCYITNKILTVFDFIYKQTKGNYVAPLDKQIS